MLVIVPISQFVSQVQCIKVSQIYGWDVGQTSKTKGHNTDVSTCHNKLFNKWQLCGKAQKTSHYRKSEDAYFGVAAGAAPAVVPNGPSMEAETVATVGPGWTADTSRSLGGQCHNLAWATWSECDVEADMAVEEGESLALATQKDTDPEHT